jgi:tetratricopeptide (TPR) repeat protein
MAGRNEQARMKGSLTRLVLLLIFPLIGGVAAASEQSELLYSRGLVEFHAGRSDKALQLFDQAVQADGADVYARYYRGVTQGRLGNYAAAVSDLRSVLAAKPDLNQGALELGVALVQTAAYKEAIPWLERAQSVASLDADASFFLGLAELRLGQLDAARRNFERAGRNPELGLASRYYEGIT